MNKNEIEDRLTFLTLRREKLIAHGSKRSKAQVINCVQEMAAWMQLLVKWSQLEQKERDWIEKQQRREDVLEFARLQLEESSDEDC